ncbi:M16 family metallopeptidase [Qipengyuania flava]|uniref:M16 family metallopeptidase n=2 Tax=Qipengyuania flava TaxID=192812 RepID=UPI001C561B6E|nr:insulinase family protein [Qipengyuania flava]MBW3168875.1 insulinase family protein [Qipengyuania flava]MBY5966113.1 insulinase family protein [Qipengyuania flava]MBY6012437.1 insulinase family protein [Qipengyuania flava]MBY6026879.1 insulinase family protein [Qipengyuania flava]
MTHFPRAIRRLALVLPAVLLVPQPLLAQEPATPSPQHVTPAGGTPWIYEGSDVPRDEEWIFGELPNGLRYAVRKNGVPPDQVSVRVRIDAGSLHEEESELGYAHLLEHLLFRESRYLGPAEAIPTWQRLGATFGSDTNAETSPTHTVYKLDLPNVNEAKLAESMKLLSGMVRSPVLSDANVKAEVPIVMAEKRERGGPGERAGNASREVLFSGQRLATRTPIGTEETLGAATGDSVSAFYKRWYRPENAVIVAAGDMDPLQLAAEIEKWFGDWQGEGPAVPAPDFGDPVAPAGADPENPVGEVGVVVEPDLPRSFTYAVMRPWRPVQDTVAYNEGLLRDALAQALINRRLESQARAGGSYLYAQVSQDDVSRSADMTFVSFAPLTSDWKAALDDIRGVIADALATPPSQEEIDRELAEFEIVFKSQVEQRRVLPGPRLADDIVNAVDIREAVAAPETVLTVFNSMRETITPELVLDHTRALFTGDVIRASYVTPATGEASAEAIRAALGEDIAADAEARVAAQAISFDDLPAVGEPGEVIAQAPIGVLDIEQVEFANGVKAILWANDAEPGRVAVKVRFGAGYRAIDPEDAVYANLGYAALIGSGIGDLGQEELDVLATGRKFGFDFQTGDGAFSFYAQTREQDLEEQLYLFAAKLAMPGWDPNPVIRAKAAGKLAYESYGANPNGVLQRDLEYLLSDRDARFRTPTPQMFDAATPEGFRETWEPLLKQGPVEVLVFGEFDKAATVDALRRTFGALAPRDTAPADVLERPVAFPEAGETVVRHHRGDANQAAAVIAWPSGAGVENLRESRRLEVLVSLFNNRLMEAMREHAGASYSPVVRSEWPSDVNSGGRIAALAQLRPEDVPVFFAEAERIAQELASAPVSEDEYNRVVEPLRQYVSRASTGNLFWLYQLEGATQDPRRIPMLRFLLADYTQTPPAELQALAQKYLGSRAGWRLAVIPQGQTLAIAAQGR